MHIIMFTIMHMIVRGSPRFFIVFRRLSNTCLLLFVCFFLLLLFFVFFFLFCFFVIFCFCVLLFVGFVVALFLLFSCGCACGFLTLYAVSCFSDCVWVFWFPRSYLFVWFSHDIQMTRPTCSYDFVWHPTVCVAFLAVGLRLFFCALSCCLRFFAWLRAVSRSSLVAFLRHSHDCRLCSYAVLRILLRLPRVLLRLR